MNRSIEQALHSLLPTHNSALPQPLTELASSLLAQSRNRASTLKAEEEIARSYACANIACDRLKITLNLPPIEPRPPIPPRIYKRLYNHLDHILPPTASTPRKGTATTPGGTSRVRTPSTKLRELQLLGTSPLASKSKSRQPEKTLADLRTASGNGTPSKKRQTPKKSTVESLLPRWMRPTLRFMCQHLGPTRIGPIVASGAESILIQDGKRTEDEWVLANLVTVLGAVYLYVLQRITWPDSGINEKEYVRFRKEIVRVLARARDEVEIKLNSGEDEEEAWEGWHDIKVADLDTATMRGSRHGWFELGWVEGVDDLVEKDRQQAEDPGSDSSRAVEQVQIRRPDTMFQERYNYLTGRKRKAYADWKEGIMKRIKELEG
ncbi:origin recognition complex, subunit 6 [Podospora australis]|uniref:Origin recognition complex, subunit 6 n=1 Tax=Podospora australis TaxID=1536484 RepID=A0AAN7AKW3_9PEZI|nr:origin recognition complex, subunit 6 [Podospora australis]